MCQLVGYSLGDHALAADSQVAQPSAERCAEYMEYAPGKPTCAAAEMAHHADEIVEYRLAAGLFGVLALMAYAGFRWVAGFTDDEARRQIHRYLLLASVTFGLAAAALLGIGVGAMLGGGDAAPRWLTDGGVAGGVLRRAWALAARDRAESRTPLTRLRCQREIADGRRPSGCIRAGRRWPGPSTIC